MKLISRIMFLLFISVSFHIFADSNFDLLESARLGNLQGVKKSLSQNANINTKDSVGTSALMYAANNDHFPVVKYLVDNNADVLAQNHSGWTASIMAGVRKNNFIRDYLFEVESKIIKSRTTGIVLAVKGTVFLENRKLQVGDRILENQTIYVDKNATCDLQIKQSESNFNLRLRENSVFMFAFKEGNNENIFLTYLKQGSMLVNFKNVFSGEKIQTVTPTTLIYFNSSSVYEVKVDSEDNAKISVAVGVLKVRIRSAEIEENPVIENTPEIKKLISELEKQEQTLVKGEYIELPQKKHQEYLDKASADILKKRALTEEFSTEDTPPLILDKSERPQIKNLSTNEINSLEKESVSIPSVEPAKLKNLADTQEIIKLINKK